MSHYRNSSGPPKNWWLLEEAFPKHDTWKNISSNRWEQIKVDLELGLPSLANQPEETQTFEDRISSAPRIPFIVDTGAEISILMGTIAEQFDHPSRRDGWDTFFVANGQREYVPCIWLSIRICGRWKRIKFGLFLPAYITGIGDGAFLGMRGVLDAHMLSITHEYVDVFRRPQRDEYWRQGPLLR